MKQKKSFQFPELGLDQSFLQVKDSRRLPQSSAYITQRKIILSHRAAIPLLWIHPSWAAQKHLSCHLISSLSSSSIFDSHHHQKDHLGNATRRELASASRKLLRKQSHWTREGRFHSPSPNNGLLHRTQVSTSVSMDFYLPLPCCFPLSCGTQRNPLLFLLPLHHVRPAAIQEAAPFLVFFGCDGPSFPFS